MVENQREKILVVLNIELFNRYDLIVFDRDGVINHKAQSPNSYILDKRDLILNLEVLTAICDLQSKQKKIAVATNQQCVGKGLISKTGLEEIHQTINSKITELGGEPIEFYTCMHLESENCVCRKPKSQLLKCAMNRFAVNDSQTIFIGDSQTDAMAANNIGVDFLFYEIKN
jgi:D-glycero-D-manno-heptose 1,7-bisphosphate phosphatase